MEYRDEEVLALSLEKPSLFEVLVDRYQSGFLRVAFKVVRSKEEAEDIVQESFTKIYLNAKRFKPIEGASFKSWAYKIVINTSFNHYKKLKRTRETIKSVDPNFYEGIPDSNSDWETEIDMKTIVSRVLPQIPPHLGEVLKKYYLEDKSQKDIAKEEEVSLAAVKMRLFRARRFFKKIINDDKNLLCLT